MKTNLDGLFKTDKDLEENGVIFVIDDKTNFKLRHFASTNVKMKAAMAAHHKPYARQVELGTLDQKKSDEILVKMFIDASLISWEGIEIDGKPLECTKENALMLFTRLPALFDSLYKYASDFANYKEDLGNS
jgi:hypothetical protein